MVYQPATMGHRFQFGIGTALPATSRYAFRRCTVGAKPVKLNTDDHMTGDIVRRSEDVVDGPYTVSGQAELAPRPDELTVLLPWITGGTFSGNVITPALFDSNTARYFSFDRYVKVFNYAGCLVNRATFASRPGQLLYLTLDIEGLTRAIANAGTFPTLDLSLMQPYVHHQAVLTLDGSEYLLNDVQVIIDNSLVLDRFNNSQTRTELPQGDKRTTRLVCNNPFTTDEYALFTMATQGVEGSIQYTNGNVSLLFEFPRLEATIQDPEQGDHRSEMPLQLDLTARSVDGHAYATEYRITNDATP